jgi:HJR/Mrr/RecB family endonuclease
LKKILKFGEYNKILLILDHTHVHLDNNPTQGELLRLYTKCHMIVSSNIRWDSIWIFGRALNDIGLLESFALNLLDTTSIASAEKVIQHIKRIEPHSDCIVKLQAKLGRAKSIELLRNEGVEFEKIQLLSGIEFEDLISTSFEKLNLKTYKTPTTGDFGADLVVEDSEGTKYVIQCKRFTAKVNLKAVQEVVAAKMHYSGDYGIVITNSEFLTSAIELAKSNQIELWNGDKLISFLSGNIEFSVLSHSIRKAAITSDNQKKNN